MRVFYLIMFKDMFDVEFSEGFIEISDGDVINRASFRIFLRIINTVNDIWVESNKDSATCLGDG